MSTKNCIACAEEILEAAKLCKHCGTMQDASNFQEPPKPVMVPHECNHETLQTWAKNDSRWLRPKIKDIVKTYGASDFVTSFDTVTKLGKILSTELIITNEHVIFGTYGGFPAAPSELYALSEFDSILIADRFDDSVHSKILGFVKNDKFVIDLRRKIVSQKTLDEFNSKLQLAAGHIPICETGEVFETHTQYFYGIGFSQSWD